MELGAESQDTASPDSAEPRFVPTIRSGSSVHIGPRRHMEDEHLKIDDLPAELRGFPTIGFPTPTAFYGVFDGHGGADAASFVRKNAVKFFLDDVISLQSIPLNEEASVPEIENCLRKGFLQADIALAEESSVSTSSGTTALAALILGRLLMVANAGDCRAVLCRKGEAIEMSQDHKPTNAVERSRVLAMGGFIEDGYLNGILSVTRALGNWDMKFAQGISPLIAEPEVRHIILTEDDEFLVMGCDGIWDVLSSQQAVSLVRRGLRKHGDPEKCAKDLVMEALCRNTFDNLTVVIVCFTTMDHTEEPSSSTSNSRIRCCSLSPWALFKFEVSTGRE